nr:MAG TPA: hypothetical protein [Caudoviricetes sp.]
MRTLPAAFAVISPVVGLMEARLGLADTHDPALLVAPDGRRATVAVAVSPTAAVTGSMVTVALATGVPSGTALSKTPEIFISPARMRRASGFCTAGSVLIMRSLRRKIESNILCHLVLCSVTTDSLGNVPLLTIKQRLSADCTAHQTLKHFPALLAELRQSSSYLRPVAQSHRIIEIIRDVIRYDRTRTGIDYQVHQRVELRLVNARMCVFVHPVLGIRHIALKQFQRFRTGNASWRISAGVPITPGVQAAGLLFLGREIRHRAESLPCCRKS